MQIWVKYSNNMFKRTIIVYTIMKIIRKVWKNQTTNQLLITIPLGEGIEKGDYIEVKKVK